MNKLIGVVLVLITMGSLGIAIHAQLQLRRARMIVAEDVSGPAAGETLLPANPAADPAPASAAAAADAARIQELRLQVAALQSSLAAAQSALAGRSNAPAAVAALPTPATNASPRATFEDRMAQIKRDDPARYDEIQKQREEFRLRIQEQADERSEFLKKVDTASMTDAQRANHEKLVQAVEQARTMMSEIATMSAEDAAAARQQMFQMISSVASLYQQERRYLLEQTGRAMGYPGAEAGQFADYIQQIYDQTAVPRGFGGRAPGNRDRGSGGATGTPGVGAPAPAP